MLVVKVEVWPRGDQDRAFEVSCVGIDNRSGLCSVSDYGVTGLMGRDAEEFVLSAEVLRHERSNGWIPLVCRSLQALALPEAAVAPLDDPIAELLRKGTHVRVLGERP